MVNGLEIVTKEWRKQINQKFTDLAYKFSLFEWEATLLDESDELKLFLLTSPTVNELEIYIDNKITNWGIALQGCEVAFKKQIGRFILTYEMLLGAIDQLEDIPKQ